MRPAIRYVPRSLVRDTYEQINRCGLLSAPVSSETDDKLETQRKSRQTQHSLKWPVLQVDLTERCSINVVEHMASI
jgi:hypothetical protein